MSRFRLEILDSFRTLAIIPVMLFHYFSRWTPPRHSPSLYPYGSDYNYFNYGYLGVPFFFIISGFVIYFTLEKTQSFKQFWKKRIIRLAPSMFIASVITFSIFIFFDKSTIFPNSHYPLNILTSSTFLQPELINHLFRLCKIETTFDYINFSYWSLWLEIQFYFYCSVIFFMNRINFLKLFLCTSISIIFINYTILNIKGNNYFNIYLPKEILEFYKNWIEDHFNLITNLPFFSIGVIFYQLYKNFQEQNVPNKFEIICGALVSLYIIYSGVQMPVRLIYVCFLLLFVCFIYFPKTLNFLKSKVIINIGQSSYFLYLIHENLGVFLIFSMGHFFFPNSPAIPICTILVMFVFSYYYTLKVDSKITKWFNTLLFNTKEKV